jgi:hypothetical protein
MVCVSRLIRLKHCTTERIDFGCVTQFDDGSYVNSIPHPNDQHYCVTAHRCGYSDDIQRIASSTTSHCLSVVVVRASDPILWGLAHGRRSATKVCWRKLPCNRFSAGSARVRSLSSEESTGLRCATWCLKPLPARTPALTLFPRKPSARLRLAVCTDALRWASRSRPGCVFGDVAALCHPRLWCSTTVG